MSKLSLLSFTRFCLNVLVLPAFVWASMTFSAQAAYQYTYTGNIFTVLNVSPNWGGEMACNPDPAASCISTQEEHVSVKFIHQTLLSGGVGLANNFSFTISINDANDPYRSAELSYPFISTLPPGYPPPVPEFPLGSAGNPHNNPTFEILSTDSFGLPTSWNISINNEYDNSHDIIKRFIGTSTNRDSTVGNTSRFNDYSGQIDFAPGLWTVSAVPEPSTYVLCLLGLGLIAFRVRRRNI